MKMPLLIIIALALCVSGSAYGWADNDDRGVGIVEKAGQTLPLDSIFFDEKGNAVTLGQVIDRPVLLSLVYFSCDHVCPQLLGALSEVARNSPPVAGKDYVMLTVSFDPADTPGKAAEARNNYMKSADMKFRDGWRFLTGDKTAINELMEAVGFKVMSDELHGFSHPVALIAISPQGKITRYLYTKNYAYGAPNRIAFLPSDISMAVADALKGKPVKGNRGECSYCFPHAPEGQGSFFDLLRTTGAVIIISIIVFFIYLSGSGRKGGNYGRTGK